MDNFLLDEHRMSLESVPCPATHQCMRLMDVHVLEQAERCSCRENVRQDFHHPRKVLCSRASWRTGRYSARYYTTQREALSLTLMLPKQPFNSPSVERILRGLFGHT